MAADCQSKDKKCFGIIHGNIVHLLEIAIHYAADLHVANLGLHRVVRLGQPKLNRHTVIVGSTQFTPDWGKHLHGFKIHLRHKNNSK